LGFIVHGKNFLSQISDYQQRMGQRPLRGTFHIPPPLLRVAELFNKHFGDKSQLYEFDGNPEILNSMEDI
jgi:hypothetical protein